MRNYFTFTKEEAIAWVEKRFDLLFPGEMLNLAGTRDGYHIRRVNEDKYERLYMEMGCCLIDGTFENRQSLLATMAVAFTGAFWD